MPFNSFDDYPMSWRPGRAELYAPIYQSLADLLERDIRSGALPAGTKLPPQRELADFLDLNPSTVTKAYKLCEVRGLVHAVVGMTAANQVIAQVGRVDAAASIGVTALLLLAVYGGYFLITCWGSRRVLREK